MTGITDNTISSDLIPKEHRVTVIDDWFRDTPNGLFIVDYDGQYKQSFLSYEEMRTHIDVEILNHW